MSIEKKEAEEEEEATFLCLCEYDSEKKLELVFTEFSEVKAWPPPEVSVAALTVVPSIATIIKLLELEFLASLSIVVVVVVVVPLEDRIAYAHLTLKLLVLM